MADEGFADLMKKLQDERAKGASLDQTAEKAIEEFAKRAKKGKFNPMDLVNVIGQVQAMETPEEKAEKEREKEKQWEKLRKHQEEYKKKQELHKQERIKRGLIPQAGTGKPEPAVLLIQPDKRTGKIKIGASRIGGLPDLPATIEWPKFEKNKFPFIAQINLSEIPKEARGKKSLLPPDGWLYAFALYDDKHYPPPVHVFIHRGPESALKRAKAPAEKDIWPIWGDDPVYESVPVTLKPRPKGDKTILGDSYARSPLAGWLFDEVFGGFGSPGEFADREFKDGDDWINLLAIQSVGSMQWSDCGHLYLIIRRSDLARGDFSNVLGEVCSS